MAFFLKNWEKYLYSILRIVVGFLFLWHGSMKLFGFPPEAGGGAMPMGLLIIGGIIEFFGGLFIMLGLFTHISAFLSSGQMAVAYWMFHANMGLLPVINHGELSVLYCFVLLYIASRGSGIWGLDNLIFKSSKENK
ncbi:MAG TPA: DoxX family protein [Bacteroidota bacterium]|nr:DoxX family protein [Bacteroidota bacterium]